MFDPKAYSRAWYLANREKTLARSAAQYQANRKLIIDRAAKRNKTERVSRLAATRRFYVRHKERWAKWRKENPDKSLANSRVYVQNRRARMLQAQGQFTRKGWRAKVQYHGWRCFYCKCGLTFKTLTMDHRKPLSRNGTNWLANLVPACKSCNSKKFTQWARKPYGIQST